MQLLEHINKQQDGTQVVMVTGHSTEELRKVAVVNLEAFYFIEKDKLDNDPFRELIKEAIEKCDESNERKTLLRDTGLGPYEKETIQRAVKELTLDKRPFKGNKPDKKKFEEEIRGLLTQLSNIYPNSVKTGNSNMES